MFDGHLAASALDRALELLAGRGLASARRVQPAACR